MAQDAQKCEPGLATTRNVENVSLDRRDLLCLGSLLLVGFCLVVLRYDSLPLQLYDESRSANNALEMVRSGHWLVPTYGGVPDHWSHPLLPIWLMSILMRFGLPPLLAVRLPTMLSTLATIAVVWGVCRYALRDRVSATIASFLLLSSLFYTRIHIARTGDNDGPLSFLILGYVLAFWKSIERPGTVRMSWFAVSAAGLVLAVMTKAVAGTFALAGLFVFALISGRLVILLSNVRVWLLALLVLSICLAYYVLREQYDPGYLQAVWRDLAGRVLAANEGHAGGPLYYILRLGAYFEPAVILLPLVALTVFGKDKQRCSFAVLCLSCAASILVVITIAETKLPWYVAPALPFLAIAAALGASDGLRWVEARELQLPVLLRARPLKIALGVLLTLTSTVTLYRNQVADLRTARQASNGQLWYGALFEELQARGYVTRLVVLDSGFETLVAGLGVLVNYNPLLKFYADLARAHGLVVSVAELGTPIAAGKLVATCDPTLVPLLAQEEGFMVGGSPHSCVFGVTVRSLEVPALR